MKSGGDIRLLGFAFIDCDDLLIVADQFQDKRFVDLTGRMVSAVAQVVPERKRHLQSVAVLWLDRDVAGDPETPLRPVRCVLL